MMNRPERSFRPVFEGWCGMRKMLRIKWQAVILVCGMILVLGTGCSPSGLRLQQSPALSFLERKSGLIAYVGNDGNIYTINQGGARQQAVTNDAKGPAADSNGNSHYYQFPTWSPDGKRLAYVSITTLGGELVDVGLHIAGSDGSNHVEPFHSGEEFPFYLYWSPDGRRISFLTSPGQGGELKLNVVPANGGELLTLDQGNALYWSWAPDNGGLLLHRRPDPTLKVVKLNGEVEETEFALQPTSFQSPAWSPNGEELLMAAETEEGKQALHLTDQEGEVKKVLATVDGTVSFGWSPDGERIAYLIDDPDSEVDTDQLLVVLNPNQQEEAIEIRDGLAVAFFWSPDSRKLAYFIPQLVAPGREGESGTPGQPQLFLTVKVLDVNRGEATQVAVFRPSTQFVNLLPFFDQYQHSLTIWSPDSQNMVFSAIDGQGEEGIFIIQSAANLEPRYIAAGEMAAWSWK